jgi:hypothetical protein
MHAVPWLSDVLVGVAAFLIGGVIPILYYWTVLLVQRGLKVTKTSWLTALIAIFLSFGLGSAALVYLSATSGGYPRVISLSAMIGFGFVRWLRGDYRYE